MSEAQTSVHYTFEYYVWEKGWGSELGHWRSAGSGGGGPTLEIAYKKLKEDIKRLTAMRVNMEEYRIEIIKTVAVKTMEEKFSGKDYTAFLLKSA